MKKKGSIKGILFFLALTLFAVFVRNLELLLHEIGDGGYEKELSSFEYSLKEREYGTIWRDVRRQQASGTETMLDRAEFDALTDYYEAVFRCYLLEAGDGDRTESRHRSLEVWKEQKKNAREKLSSYRFRKAADQIQEIYSN